MRKNVNNDVSWKIRLQKPYLMTLKSVATHLQPSNSFKVFQSKNTPCWKPNLVQQPNKGVSPWAPKPCKINSYGLIWLVTTCSVEVHILSSKRQLGHVDIFLATTILCSLSTLKVACSQAFWKTFRNGRARRMDIKPRGTLFTKYVL